MNADQALHDAIQDRIAKENAFFNLLKKAIKDAVDEFKLCDTSTSPEIEDSVQLSIAGLNEATRKLKDETVLNKEAAKGITDYFTQLAQENHVVQDSTYTTKPNYFAPTATPAPIPPVAPATPIVNGTPAPRSFLDRARGMFVRTNASQPNINRDAWESLAEDPNTLHTNPVLQSERPIYQAQPVNPYSKYGGKRKTRKYRRRV